MKVNAQLRNIHPKMPTHQIRPIYNCLFTLSPFRFQQSLVQFDNFI